MHLVIMIIMTIMSHIHKAKSFFYPFTSKIRVTTLSCVVPLKIHCQLTRDT